MIKQPYQTLNPFEFGRQLINTNDLDPIYVMLYQAKLDEATLKYWLVAYWCFYHAGTASWITSDLAEGGYWRRFMLAAQSSEHPRSAERRHFRGHNAIQSTEFLMGTGMDKLWQDLLHNSMTLSSVTDYIKSVWLGFGDWIAFKIADMLERLDLAPVTFRATNIFAMYDAPRKGADEVMNQYPEATSYMGVYNLFIKNIGAMKAPPRHERAINIQEIETILCKWKSHLNGKYPVGKDCREIHEGLHKYITKCPLAERLMAAGDVAKLWAMI